jgi:hypothetical protein
MLSFPSAMHNMEIHRDNIKAIILQKEVHFNCEVAGTSTDAMSLYRQSNGSHENCETRLKK